MAENIKHTLWTLLNKYKRIEIPVIQRDYVQGRAEVEPLRRDFVNYLVKHLVDNDPVELDFVYGVEQVEDGLFIPLDGQQRLTSLFLLHWYIAYKEGKLSDDVRRLLSHFTYETRPSSCDFVKQLCSCELNHKDISEYIQRQAYWFVDDWMLDPSVSGMLTMIRTFENHKKLNESLGTLFERLIDPKMLISFYFHSLEDQYGLGEKLYIRMNARGKILTPFENFKSSFYKIISGYPHLEDIKNKMEYQWVDNLWEYRENQGKKNEVFVTDTYFMQYLNFITQILYYATVSKERERVDVDFVDFEILKEVYSIDDNVDFLRFALDIIPTLKDFHKGEPLLGKWEENSSLADILKRCINNKVNDNTERFVLYGAIRFLYQQKGNQKGMLEYLRVVRNLIKNTKDSSQREWYKIIPSIHQLISEDVYSLLRNPKSVKLDGFYLPQKEEEIFKAKLYGVNPNIQQLVYRIEDNHLLCGNVTSFFIALNVDAEDEFKLQTIKQIDPNTIKFEELEGVYNSYKEIAKDYFSNIWGDLLCTSMYKETEWRCEFDYDEFEKHCSIMLFAKEWYFSGLSLDEFILNREKNFVNNMVKKYKSDLEDIEIRKEQLYLLYIISKQLKGYEPNMFFKNEGYNFGWLDYSSGYSTPFKNDNSIYQTYSSYFQYNRGLKEYRTPEVLLANKRPKMVFDKLIEWAR